MLTTLIALGALAPLPLAPPQDGQEPRPLRVTLDLRLPDGEAPKAARVRFDYDEDADLDRSFADWTADSPEVRAVEERATVTVFAGFDGFPESEHVLSRWISEPLELDAKTVGRSAVTVELAPRPRLRVDIVGNEGDDAGSSFLGVVPRKSFDPGSPDGSFRAAMMAHRQRGRARGLVVAADAGAPSEGPIARSGATSFHFDLEPGEYVVGYSRQQLFLESFEYVTVREGETRLEYEVEDVDARGSITLRIFGPDGEPLELLRFGHRVEGDWFSMSVGSTDHTTVARGVYTMRLSDLDPPRAVARRSLTPPRITVQLQSQEYGERVVEVLPGVDTYDVHFRRPVDAVLRVLGDGADGLFLRITSPGSELQKVVDATEQDRVSVQRLQGTELVVDWVVADPRFEPRRLRDDMIHLTAGLVVGSERIDVTEGGEFVVRVPPTSTLTIDASEFETGTELRLSPPAARDRATGRLLSRTTAKVDDDGRAVFPRVGPGPHVVSVAGYHKPLDVTVDGDTSARMPRIEATAFVVEMDDPLGTFGASGLLHGDLLLGRDGERFESSTQLGPLIREAMDDPVPILVERDGEALELELGPLGERTGHGAKFAPFFGE